MTMNMSPVHVGMAMSEDSFFYENTEGHTETHKSSFFSIRTSKWEKR